MSQGFRLYLEGRVKDVMSTNPVVINKDEGLDGLLDIFKAYHFHGFPVVDKRGALVGIIRDTDLISIFARRDPASRSYSKVEDVMFSPPLVIEAGATIQTAIMKMFSDQTRFLAVIDEKKELAGIVTRVDLIKGIFVKRGEEAGG
jgi:CBS domain-containing protein